MLTNASNSEPGRYGRTPPHDGVTLANPELFVKKWILLGFVLRIVFTFLLHLISLSLGRSGFFFLDDESYHLQGIFLARFYSAGVWNIPVYAAEFIGSLNFGYPFFLGVLYTFLGPSLLVAKLCNAVFGAWVIKCTYDIAQSLFDTRVARVSTVAVALFPNLLFWGSMLLKDTLLMCAVVTATWLLVGMASGGLRLSKVAALVACLAVVLTLRGFLLPVLLVGYTGFLIVNSFKKTSSATLLAGTVLVVSACFAITTVFMAGYVRSVLFTYQPVLNDFSTAFISVEKIVRGGILTLVDPLPWVFESDRPIMYLMYPGQWAWILSLPAFILGALRLLKENMRACFLLITPMVGLTVVYIFFYGSGGLRQFMLWYPFCMIIMAYAYTAISQLRLVLVFWWCLLPLVALAQRGLVWVAIAIALVIPMIIALDRSRVWAAGFRSRGGQ